MFKNMLLLLLVLMGCRTSMGTRKDASPGAEVGAADSAPEIFPTSDGARPDLPVPDAAVIEVVQPPVLDAGAPDAPANKEAPDSNPSLDTPVDSLAPDTARDLGSEAMSAVLSEVAGGTFKISASEALPDASLSGRSCGTSNPGATYALTFSEDGTKVTIVRTDPVQEMILKGTLQASSSSTLTYNLDNAFAGGALSIRREGGNLIGELVLYGSGVPVLWCIESPMRPA